MFTVYLSEHQKPIHSFLKHQKFWTRLEDPKEPDIRAQLDKIWTEIEANVENLDLLLILYKLSNVTGKR